MRASLTAQVVKNPPAMQEIWVRSLGWEDSLQKGKATHSSILAWRIPWTLPSMGSQRVRQLSYFHLILRASLVAQTLKNQPAIQETGVQSLSQEDPLEKGMATHSSILAWRILMDRGAWPAAVHGVAENQT